MLCVPAGEFLMGSTDSDEYAKDDEKPQHRVFLDAFWIDQTEVTNAMYAQCVSAGTCVLPQSPYNHYNDGVQYANHPVANVLWEEANAYCKWAGRDLPTEAQWEKAARGTDRRTYPWGEHQWGDIRIDCSFVNTRMCVGDTTEVGSYPTGASPYGALDMACNVWEWVQDWYSATFYQSSPDRNPSGPASGEYHVWRGGGYNDYEWDFRSAARTETRPEYGDPVIVGFRCARSP